MIGTYRSPFQERWKQYCIIPSKHKTRRSISAWMRSHHLTCRRGREYTVAFPLCETLGVI